MTILRTINLVLITVLSIAAGIPKVTRMAEEVRFFEGAGLGTTPVVIFGMVQLAGGALLVLRRTRMWGAAVVALTFIGSAAMLFVAGKIPLGFVTIVPIVMAAFVLKESAEKAPHISG